MSGDLNALFRDGVLWVSQELGLSRRQVALDVLSWLRDETGQLGDTTKKAILQALGLHDAQRREAEELLCGLLERGISRFRTWHCWQGSVARRTDWAATAIGRRTGRRGQYRAVIDRQAPDLDTISALATVAADWAGELELISELTGDEGLAEREAMLRQALERPMREEALRAVAMNEAVLARLGRVEGGSRFAALLAQTYLAQSRPLTKEDARMLRTICQNETAGGADNRNHLFEIISVLALVRGFSKLKWRLKGDFRVARRKTGKSIDILRGFELDNGNGWTVYISKDPPETHEDMTHASKQALFGQAAGRIQPDIILRFSGPNDGFWIIGDAKHSEDEQGGYARKGFDAMMKYLVAFAPKTGFQVQGNRIEQKTVNGIAMPAGILFSNCPFPGRRERGQAFNLVEGVCLDDIAAILGRRRAEGRLRDMIGRISSALGPEADERPA